MRPLSPFSRLRGSVARLAFGLTLALASACAAITGLEAPEHDVPAATADGAAGPDVRDSASAADTSALPDAGTDAFVEPDAPSCPTASETLPTVRDAVLTYVTSHQDFSDQHIGNLNSVTVPLAFTRAASVGKKIVSVTLQIPRATSADCGSPPCTNATFHGAGSLTARHMRTDWTSDADWVRRTANVADVWATDGALGANDSSGVLATVAVAAADPMASIPIAGALLHPEWDTPTLAFMVASTTAFEFVVQRAIGSALSRPTLIVTYCQ